MEYHHQICELGQTQRGVESECFQHFFHIMEKYQNHFWGGGDSSSYLSYLCIKIVQSNVYDWRTMKKYLSIICLLLVAMSVYFLRDENGLRSTIQEKLGKSAIPRYVVVLDAGHGGFDPGKIGVGGEKEKEINLQITMKLKRLLELNDCEVILTRDSDDGLYEAGDTNKKRSDMKKRVDIIKEANPDIAISIHQNSFTGESSRGAQVFYHAKSEQGKQLAEIIQEQMKTTLQDGNHRVAKSNESYYMLKKSICPLVIVECGFLSNYQESKLLCDDAYQDRVAWAIHLGVMNYLANGMKGNTK